MVREKEQSSLGQGAIALFHVGSMHLLFHGAAQREGHFGRDGRELIATAGAIARGEAAFRLLVVIGFGGLPLGIFEGARNQLERLVGRRRFPAVDAQSKIVAR